MIGPREFKDSAASIVLTEIVLDREYRTGRSDKGKKRSRYNVKLPGNYRSCIMSANKRKIGFNLTIDEFFSITSRDCAYCGSSNRIGIDRINSRGAYELDNCAPCCGTCNKMKHSLEVGQFIKHIHRIVDHVKNSDFVY